MNWIKISAGSHAASNGAFIVKDSIIGWLVYRCKAAWQKGEQDYRSFPKLREAKSFAESRLDELAPFPSI